MSFLAQTNSTAILCLYWSKSTNIFEIRTFFLRYEPLLGTRRDDTPSKPPGYLGGEAFVNKTNSMVGKSTSSFMMQCHYQSSVCDVDLTMPYSANLPKKSQNFWKGLDTSPVFLNGSMHYTPANSKPPFGRYYY